MPSTVSQINGCDAQLLLDNAAGSLRDISGSSNETGINLTNELGVLYTFGTRFPVRSECKSDAQIALNVIYTEDDGEAMEIILNWFYVTRGQKSFRIRPHGDYVGGDQFDFEVFLESFDIPISSQNANPILASGVLRPTGTFTRSTIAS